MDEKYSGIAPPSGALHYRRIKKRVSRIEATVSQVKKKGGAATHSMQSKRIYGT